MERNIIKTKIYSIEWEERLYFISLNFNAKEIILYPYRPPALSKYFNGEDSSEEGFLNIWTRFIIGLSVCSEEEDIIERSIGALTFTVMDSILTKGKISFEDLLNHIDCFSIMLKEEGLSDDMIRTMYIPISKALLSNFKDLIIDPNTGKKFIETPQFKEFEKLENK